MIDHLILEADEYLFHVVFGFPMREDGELGGLDLSVLLVHTGHIDFRTEGNFRRLVWVVWPAPDGQEIDTVVIVGVGWSDDGSLPVGEGGIVSYSHLDKLSRNAYPWKDRMRRSGHST